MKGIVRSLAFGLVVGSSALGTTAHAAMLSTAPLQSNAAGTDTAICDVRYVGAANSANTTVTVNIYDALGAAIVTNSSVGFILPRRQIVAVATAALAANSSIFCQVNTGAIAGGHVRATLSLRSGPGPGGTSYLTAHATHHN
jgi:hypothetical protein